YTPALQSLISLRALTMPPALFPYTTLFRSTFFCCMESRRARLLPNDKALFPPVCIWRIMKNQRAASRMIGARLKSQPGQPPPLRSEEHTSELQSLRHLVCRLLLEKKKKQRQ